MPKAKKKSKKQRKKELEEKRRIEEELLRQQQEEERKRQEELERQRREEEERQRLLREKKRKEELIRLEKENEEDIELIEKRQIDLNKLISQQYQQIEWKKHLKCDPAPDISNKRQLNNFVTEWKMNINKENNTNDIKNCIKDVENGYKLLPILQDVIFDAIQNGNEEKLAYAKRKYMEMGEIAQNKLDIFTQKCLKGNFFSSVADAGLREDGDVQKSAMERNVKYGLWASAMSNAFKNSKISFKSPISIALELPKQIAMKAKIPLACRCIQFSHNFYIYFNNGKEYECVGPVIDVQLFKLPLPPRNIYNNNKVSSGWMVQNISEESCTPIKYEYANIDEPDEKSAETISISFQIPSYVLIADINNINLGWWDFKKNEWKISDFKDISYDSQSRIISFVTSHLSPISIVQERGKYYEYTDWKLTPCGVERCKITLFTKCKLNIEIEIIGSKCRLLAPTNQEAIAELSHIYNCTTLKPHQLIRLLRTSGVNLCHKNDGNIYSNLSNKNADIVQLTHLEISSIAALFEISMSKWNKIANNENIIIFRLRKPLTPNEEADLKKESEDRDADDNNESSVDSWQTVMINEEKCTFIDCNEKSKEINLNIPIRELSHKTLLRCLNSYLSEDNIRDLQNTSFRFKETIKRMLNLLNLFSV